MKSPTILVTVLCLFAGPALSQQMHREPHAGLGGVVRSAPRTDAVAQHSQHAAQSRHQKLPRTNEESIWIIGCRLIINFTDTIETADEMQRDLDEALSGEPCRRAVAEISLAGRLRLIRQRIRELREEEG